MAVYTNIPAVSAGGGLGTGTLATPIGNLTNWDFATGLNGDSDGDYELWGELFFSGAPLITLQPNAISANQETVGPTGNQSGTAGAISDQTSLFIVDGPNTGANEVMFHAILSSKSGRNRLWVCDALRIGTGTVSYRIEGKWLDTATVITSLRLNSSVASGILSTSYVRWRKWGFTV